MKLSLSSAFLSFQVVHIMAAYMRAMDLARIPQQPTIPGITRLANFGSTAIRWGNQIFKPVASIGYRQKKHGFVPIRFRRLPILVLRKR